MAYRNKEDRKEYNRMYYERTKVARSVNDSYLQSQKDYRERTKESKKEYDRIYASENKEKKNSNWARRRAMLLNQTPGDANNMWIDMIYDYRPEGYEVDHIIPLARGGLHHEDNLQYLTCSENRSKGAR